MFLEGRHAFHTMHHAAASSAALCVFNLIFLNLNPLNHHAFLTMHHAAASSAALCVLNPKP